MADVEAENLKQRMQICLYILQKYDWLIDSYILDFFVENHFQKFPESWLSHFQQISFEDLGRYLDFEKCELKGIWPLSLLTLRALCKLLCLTRKPINFEPDTTYSHNESSKTPSSFECEKIKNYLSKREGSASYHRISPLRYASLKNLFVKHVKPKKRYEILKMASITAKVAHELDVDYLVDVGSGLGHLSRVSGFGFGLNVLSLESQATFSNHAEKLDKELEITASKHLPPEHLEMVRKKKPIHIQKTISNDISPREFLQFVRQCFNNSNKDFKFGIVGLHPCGDLALILLKYFIYCEEIKFINVVGCCYHKLTVQSNNIENNSFPVSAFGKNISAYISYEGRALACHALESYSKRLQAHDYHHLQIHCFRATLEYLINKNWQHLRKTALCNVKHGPELTFEKFDFSPPTLVWSCVSALPFGTGGSNILPNLFLRYCQKALKNHKVVIPQEDLHSKQTSEFLSKWKNVVTYYSLRLLLAPLIETVILIDRMLFLLENGYQCNVGAVFDPEISPRNFVVSATKS